jgi:outer membrane protein TolC
LTITRSSIFPQVNFSSGWTRNGGVFYIGSIEQIRTFNNFSTGFSGSLLLFDFGKTYSRISASSKFEDAAVSDLMTARQTLILNVYTSYFNYLQALRLKNVTTDILKQAEEHLTEAQALFKVGTRPQLDVLQAETQVQNAKVNLLNAENNIRLAKLQLENTLNIKLSVNFLIKDNLGIRKDTINQDYALNTAISNRPELISSKYKVEANKTLLTSAWTANLPSINAVGGYSWKTIQIDKKFNDSWNFGFTFSLPIFQGFALNAGIQQARANLSNALAQSDVVIQAVTLDVQQQYSNLLLAQSQIEASSSLVKQSEETVKIAEGRYRSGIGSSLDVTDARVTLLNAQTLYIQSLYNYQVGYVRLQRAMGVLK